MKHGVFVYHMQGCPAAEEGVAAFVDMFVTNSGLQNVAVVSPQAICCCWWFTARY